MKTITLAFGAPENMSEDIQILARRCTENPRLVVAEGEDVKSVVIENASALFVEENRVLVLVNPPLELLKSLREQIDLAKERIHLIVYATVPDAELGTVLNVEPMVLEKERESRIKSRVIAMGKQYGKKITDKAFALLKERIRDEALLDMELRKLIDYVGDRKTIESKDVAVTVSAGHEDSLIMLYDALATRQKKEVSRIFAHLLGQGLHVLAIHNFLVKQMRLLLHAKDAETLFKDRQEYKAFAGILSRMKEQVILQPLDRKQYLPFQKPYYAFTLSRTSVKFSSRELEAFFSVLAAYDRSIKKGTRHEVTRLESGILGM